MSGHIFHQIPPVSVMPRAATQEVSSNFPPSDSGLYPQSPPRDPRGVFLYLDLPHIACDSLKMNFIKHGKPGLARIVGKTVLVIIITVFIISCGKEDEMERERAKKMQDFVIEISSYARAVKPGFIIIPQNGIELAFNETDMDSGIRTNYISAIDGFGIEELFYDGGKISASDSDRKEKLAMLDLIKPHNKKIMVSDFVSNDSDIPNAVTESRDRGFISFVRSKNNYDYQYIPTGTVTDAHTGNIAKLADAKNYLYLISSDEFATKQAMINAVAATNYDLVLMDLFYENDTFTSSDLAQIRNKNGGGTRLIIAYISIGSAETYRYYFQSGWKKGNPSWLAKNYEGYNDEFWVEYWNDQWRKIIMNNGNNDDPGDNSYIRQIINAGFDGVYLDNVEAYYYLGKKAK